MFSEKQKTKTKKQQTNKKTKSIVKYDRKWNVEVGHRERKNFPYTWDNKKTFRKESVLSVVMPPQN